MPKSAPFQSDPTSASPDDAIYVQTNLVSDIQGLAEATDPHLVNPWGVSFRTGSPFWISDQGSNSTTLYSVDGSTGTVVDSPAPVFTVNIPCPTRLLQPLQEGGKPRLSLRIVRREVHEHADASHPAGRLLRARHKRPRDRRADQRDEVAPFHSITSSARARSIGGISRPSAFAVLRLRTSSRLVGNSIGRSPGATPFRILCT